MGCDNVHIDSKATDVSYVMKKYTDGGTNLAPAKTCLKKKCLASASSKILMEKPEEKWDEQPTSK